MIDEINDENYIVYILIFTNGKKYVGITTRRCEERKREHLSCSRNENPKYILHKAIKLYGENSFDMIILETTKNVNELKLLEKKYIQLHNTYFENGLGYNMSLGGEGNFGYKFTDEIKLKMSQIRKELIKNNPEILEKWKETMKNYWTVEKKLAMSILKKEYYKNNPDKHHWKSTNRSISKPCENFKRVIEESNLFYIPEMTISDERFFSIDISLPQYKIGIEINGNQHYESNGCLKEYYQKRHDYIVSLGWNLYELHYSLCFNDDVIKSILNNIISNIDDIYEFDYDMYLLDKLNRNKQNVCDCGKNINKQSKKCGSCAIIDSAIKRRKVERPAYESLIVDVEKIGYSATGRKYGVSDNSIRKWIKYYNLIK